MLNNLVRVTEAGLSFLAEKLKVHVEDYCDLETTCGDHHLVAKDASLGTVFRYEGFRSLVSHKEFVDFCDALSNGIETFLGQRGHQVQVVFIREDDATEEVMRYMAPSYETCEVIGMDMRDILDEKRRVMSDYCMDEQVYIVLWSRPSVLDPVELRLNKEETQELVRKYKIPSLKHAQNFLRPNRFLVDRHDAFVGHFLQLVQGLKGGISTLGRHEAICSGKRFLYRATTPASWEPTLLGDPMFARWKEKRSLDYSELSYPRLESQIFSSPAQNGGEGGLNDVRAVRIGDRLYAPMFIKRAPKRIMSFGALFNMLNKASANTDRGDKPLPWSISFMLTGDGLKGEGLRTFFARVLSMGEDNRNLANAMKSLAEYKSDGGTVVKMQITACTWASYPNEKELMLRRSKLVRALNNWGSCDVEEETGDAAEAVITSAPGLTTYAKAPGAAPPLPTAISMLPWARPASPFHRGQSLYRTLDGKVLPWEYFSDQQNTWVTIWFGGPGSGKSVQANRANLEMCLMGGLKKLPWVAVIDFGISSSGFTGLVEDSLPEDMRHLSMYVRLQNTEKYSINICGDTQLGCRYPLAPEREFKKNFMTLLATPATRGKAHVYMEQFVARVITETYRRFSDQEERGQPKGYEPTQCPDVAEKVEQLGIETTEATKWWDIVDALYERGHYYHAAVAQRYAVPILMDFLNTANDREVQKDFLRASDDGTPVYEEFNIMIGSAIDEFKLFNDVTRFDVGESRVMAIDLQDVAIRGTSPAAKKTSALMTMAAVNIFMSKINICEELLDTVNQDYRSYHAKRVEELAEEYKRLFLDEYHNSGNNEQLREGFLIYGRESRKWGLELVVASQLPQDFRELAEIATTTIIMDAGNEKTRGTIREIFGLSESEVAALKKYVHGPVGGVGATFLAKVKTKEAELTQLFTSTMGGQELWSLSTTLEDRALRNRLYKVMPSPEARRVLARRFPGGSCKSHVLKIKSEVRASQGEAFIDEDVQESIIQNLARDLVGEWERMKLEGAFAH